MNSWVEHVKEYCKIHGCKYGEALKLAKDTYKKGSGITSSKPPKTEAEQIAELDDYKNQLVEIIRRDDMERKQKVDEELKFMPEEMVKTIHDYSTTPLQALTKLYKVCVHFIKKAENAEVDHRNGIRLGFYDPWFPSSVNQITNLIKSYPYKTRSIKNKVDRLLENMINSTYNYVSKNAR